MGKKVGLGGKKKELNADINLTPFIDLLSTCVCFLLVTAVWIEIGSVEIKQSHGTQAAVTKEETFDLDVVFRSPTNVRLNLKRNGRRIQKLDVKSNEFKDIIAQIDKGLTEKLSTYRKKPIEIASATITPRTGVNYGNLMETLDVLRKNEIINIGILSARGR